MLPGKQVIDFRPEKEITGVRGFERGAPSAFAVLPFYNFKILYPLELLQLVLAGAFDPAIVSFRRFIKPRPFVADGEADGDRRLNVEDVFGFSRAAPFAAEIDDPDFIAEAAQERAHADKGV